MLEGLPLGYKSIDMFTLGFVSTSIMWITLLKYNWEKKITWLATKNVTFCFIQGCWPLQLAMHRLGSNCPQGHGHCTVPCCPGSIPVGEISMCTKACKFKIGFEEKWVVFFPEAGCFSEHLCQLACLGEYLQKWNAEVLRTQPNWIHLQM